MPVAVPLTDAENRNELISHFHGAVADHEDVMAECRSSRYRKSASEYLTTLGLALLRLYNLTASDLFYKYEAFVLSRPSGVRAKLNTISIGSVKELRQQIQRDQMAQHIAAQGASADTSNPAASVRKAKGAMLDLGGLYVSLQHAGINYSLEGTTNCQTRRDVDTNQEHTVACP